MKNQLLLYLFLGLVLASCQQPSYQDNLPVLSFEGQVNKIYTYTNKISGFYLGNTHKQNESGHDGWTVNEIHYLLDYKIYDDEHMISRDSLVSCIYNPAKLIRDYPGHLRETFALLDTIDALIWIFERAESIDTFSFEPVTHQPVAGKQRRLDRQHAQLVYSPRDISGDGSNEKTKWMGFELFEDGNFIVVIAALGQEEITLKQQLLRIREAYALYLNNREKRQRNIIARNDFNSNLPELNSAVIWSQIAIDALVTRQRGKGIWAGLPWFNNYWGRDTFISYAGALLVSGQYDAAADILKSFSHYQLADSADRWYGRIPNRITNDEIIYNTADGTWWFIRELYEYALYSGDIATVRELFPAVKMAISGALRYRVDRNFYLMHEDAETWMDAKGPDGAWSPRGNRAVEIQALWYTSLQAGAIMASISDQPNLAEHWLAISQTLRHNFLNDYWNSFSLAMTDHLNPDGSRDRKKRPNQIFTTSIPDLPGIEPLVSDEIRAHITSQIITELTYRYGVASLSQDDPDFHPWHHYEPFYVQDEAYHNGIVWTWLSGPVVGSLTALGYEDLAFQLTFNQAIQILDWDAIGNYCELLDALPRPGETEPRISGTVSQAWSLAEYARNIYQHYIGFQPNALTKTVIFKPAIPYEISFISAKLPYGSGWINFSYTVEEEYFNIIISRIHVPDTLNIVLKFPGYPEQYIEYDPDGDLIEFKLPRSTRQMYQQFPQLEWYFAQPELKTNLETVTRPAYPVLRSDEFYFDPDPAREPDLVAKDPLFDDHGPNGKYAYPLNPLFAEGIFDLSSMELYDLEDQWGFVLNFRELVNPNWHPAYGFQLTFTAIAIHNPRSRKNSKREIGKGAGQVLSADRAYHDILYIGGGVTLEDANGIAKVLLYPDDPYKPLGFKLRKQIRFRIPKAYLPYLDKNTRFTIFAGGQDDHGGAGIGEFRQVLPQPGPWHGGGADHESGNSRIYDVLEIN